MILTNDYIKALSYAVLVAFSKDKNYINGDDIFIGIYFFSKDEKGISFFLKDIIGLDFSNIDFDIDLKITDKNLNFNFSKKLQKKFDMLVTRYKKLNFLHLLYIGLYDISKELNNFLKSKKINILKLRRKILEFIKKFEVINSYGFVNENIESEKNNIKSNEKKLNIEYFGIDLTQQAKQGLLEPLIGREKYVDQIIYTLFRKTKNNVLLIGEPGVGKTAIVEGLAQRIANQQVPQRLINKRIFYLDLGSIIAGTKYRGEFEARFKTILEEATDPSNNIILFIDEIHTILGAGSAEGSLDAANLLKPLLARGKIQIIGATTFDEYQKYFEKDAALKRRFQEIIVDEPTPSETYEILKGLKERFENFHGVNIDDEALKNAINLSVRYILNRYLPDKAIDLVDEACARKSVIENKLGQNEEYNSYQEQILNLEKLLEEKIANQEYFEAAEIKKQIDDIKQKIKNLRQQMLLPKNLRPVVTKEDVMIVLAEKIGLPLNIFNQSEIEKLKNFEVILKEKFLGQDEVVEQILDTLKRHIISPIKRNKPIASFLFLGPSGVGKTYLAKLLAKHYFHDEKALVRFDMSEYMEKYSVSKLIGSAPGYVGYEEGGMLTESIRRKPYSVVLFDEIEKASLDILNILLQVLDEGYIRDNKGRYIDFKNTIIILTSNLGSEYFSIEGKPIGFEIGQNQELYQQAKDLVIKKVFDILPKEFVNRLDNILVFKPLSKEILKKIFKIKFEEFIKEWSVYNIDYKINDDEIEKIIDKIYDPSLGARPIERYIYNDLQSQLINKIFSGN